MFFGSNCGLDPIGGFHLFHHFFLFFLGMSEFDIFLQVGRNKPPKMGWRGVVSNLSSPVGLLMSDVHMSESCVGAALVHSGEVIALMAPSLRSSSGETGAFGALQKKPPV